MYETYNSGCLLLKTPFLTDLPWAGFDLVGIQTSRWLCDWFGFCHEDSWAPHLPPLSSAGGLTSTLRYIACGTITRILFWGEDSDYSVFVLTVPVVSWSLWGCRGGVTQGDGSFAPAWILGAVVLPCSYLATSHPSFVPDAMLFLAQMNFVGIFLFAKVMPSHFRKFL